MWLWTLAKVAFNFVTGNSTVFLIGGAVLLASNAISGGIGYYKGYNTAATGCRVNTIIRERDELKRDRDVQKTLANEVARELAQLKDREEKRGEQNVQDQQTDAVKPSADCTVPDVAPARVRRGLRPQR